MLAASRLWDLVGEVRMSCVYMRALLTPVP